LSRLRAALFDMDGTIFDSKIDLAALRRDLGLPRDARGILEQIRDLSPEAREKGLAALLAAEAESAARGELIPGTVELLGALTSRGVRCALITNNSRASVDAMFAKFPLPFELSLSRNDGPTKPNPELFRVALGRLGVSPDEAIAIGDAHLDLLAAHAAGVAEIVLVSPQPWVLDFIPTGVRHRRAADLREARAIVESLLDSSAPLPP
jgi:HAD superfamily hydrolase (TIGR01509 family)